MEFCRTFYSTALILIKSAVYVLLYVLIVLAVVHLIFFQENIGIQLNRINSLEENFEEFGVNENKTEEYFIYRRI